MFSNRLVSIGLAVGVGIATGVYVFKPLLQEYEEETKGTWIRPGDEVKLKAIQEKKNSN
ncbi:hypothetical protein K501DRAFT_175563 [Backusella circina FSU 941]|nr:hypothetical protein K501DRAFT_175563 [Backusella circina FSU 941]